MYISVSNILLLNVFHNLINTSEEEKKQYCYVLSGVSLVSVWCRPHRIDIQPDKPISISQLERDHFEVIWFGVGLASVTEV